jgi:outer membrane protein
MQMTTSKHLWKISFFMFALLLSGFSMQAQRIAYVDINKILESMEEYQLAQQELDRTAKEWRQDIKMKYDEIQSMYNKYQAEQVLLSDEMRKKREDEIMEAERRVRDMQKDKFGPEGQLFEKRKKLVQPVQDKVYVAIESYANSRGYDFIFDKSGNAGIIFSNPRYDKTEDILKELGIE